MKQNYEKKKKHRQNKRRLATQEGAKFDLREELPLMFKAFNEAHELYEREIVQTPPQARGRGFEASLLNSKMLQCIQQHFPNNWKFGKYKRFTLRVNSYIILFKKLDKNSMPMNIKTNSVQAISQQLSLSLFSEESYVEEPILFFGYKKNIVGAISEPKLVYLDENKIQWIVTLSDITIDKTIQLPRNIQKATPILKKGREDNKKVG
jgi:hypothetical protein